MNKIFNFNDRRVVEKQCKDLTDEAECFSANKSISINSNSLAMLASKSAFSLGIAIAALSGCLIYAVPARAAFNIPTASVGNPIPSPLCSIPTFGGQPTMNADGTANANCPLANKADPFTAKMLMFEEFGLKDTSSLSSSTLSTATLPPVPDCQSMPDGPALDKFLEEGLNSLPSRATDLTSPNPWETKIKACVPGVTTTNADGRPGGEEFAHQRWSEFWGRDYTGKKAYFQSAQTGARVNGGLRNNLQMHGYNKGEFAPGGLYYMQGTDGKPGTAGIQIKIHPNLPTQDPNSVWTFDGTLPPKLLMARYGEAIIFRHYNALPIDAAANNGFGRHTISTHEHNGHNPAESDGFMHAYSYPGQFYEYHWPMVLAGHDSINTGALDPKTGAPDGSGGITPVPGDWHETMSTHWFHDHMLDYTAQNVYKGNAAMMNYYSAIDRGREPANATERDTVLKQDGKPSGYGCHYANPLNANLCLPSGTGLDWGNRDYDVNLVVADKAWDTTGQLKFNIFNTDGFLGDRATVNWEYKPYLDVRPRRYRFRILNGSVSRNWKIAIVQEAVSNTGAKSYTKIPYYMIANDGNIMQHAIPFPNAQSPDALPEQGIAERHDIIVDFAGMAPGTKLYMVNLAEHSNGLGPQKYIPLADVLSPARVNGVASNNLYVADGIKGDPVVGKFLEFRVGASTGVVDYSMKPADYVEGKKQMIPSNKPTTAELKAAVHRTFEFGKSSGTDASPWTIKTDGGGGLSADEHRVSAAPELPANPSDLGKVEIWHIKLGGNGWTHPVHVHFEEGQILYRGGKAPPIWEKYARKDVYRIGPLADSTGSVDMAIRFREFAGTYVEHCHNTQHEDHAMLLRWDIEHPGQTVRIPTPMPDWNGVQWDPTITLPTAKIGDLAAKKAFKLP